MIATPGSYAGGSRAAAAGGQREILTSELDKATAAVATAQQSGDSEALARAMGDVKAVQSELARLPKVAGAPAAPLIGPGVGAPRASANVVELSAAEQAANKAQAAAAESMASGTGKMLEASAEQANSALQAVGTAQRLQRAIDSDRAFTGPGATYRMKGAQLSELLGVQGKNDAERIANTRIAMQELAKLTLAGRAQMKGQGAITESESGLAARASSGNIEEFTPAEIKILAGAAERSARWQYQQHQNKLAGVAKNPAAAPLLDMYRVDALPDPLPGNRMDPFAPPTRAFKGTVGAPGSAAPVAPIDDLVKKYAR
jgi:hypothetical protein